MMCGVTPGRLGMRVLTRDEMVRVLRVVGLLYLGSGVAVGVAPVAGRNELSNAPAHVVVVCVTLLIGVAVLAAPRFVEAVEPHAALLVHGLLLAGTALSCLGLVFVGRAFELGVVVIVPVAIFAFYLLRRAWAVAHLAAIGVAFAGVLRAWGGRWALPRWLFLMLALAAVGACVGLLLERAERLAAELTTLNATLERRVEEQVAEVTRLGRLRRFLSPQVADAVLGSDAETLLAPHRRRIAVLFCDLRGFTRFAGAAEPEDVAEVLAAYYGVVGDLVRRFEATVGTFAGDGIMAYFNDPVPCDDPPGRALDLACSLREPMTALVATWERAGFRLGYGVGVAYGYATLGTIGFEGRYDYTAVGTVVNLAARLCAEAGPGEVLLDERAYDAVAARVPAAPREIVVKGMAEPVRAFSVAP